MKTKYAILLATVIMFLTSNLSVLAETHITDSMSELSLEEAIENGFYNDDTGLEKVYVSDGSEIELFENENNITTSGFISNTSNREYLDMMINYYLNNNSNLMSTLQSGNPVVMLFEGGSDNVDNSTYNSGTRYRVSAVCIVLKYNASTGSPYIAYASENCSSMPDHPLAYGAYSHGYGSAYGTATLKDGIYQLYTVNHKGEYAALNVRNNGSGSVPAVYMKSDGTYSELNASGINMHTRTTSYVSGQSNPWSAGCLLIGGSTPFTEYNNFIDAVSPSNCSKGTTTYKSNSVYYYSSGEGTYAGMLVVDRYLHKNKMIEIYQNSSAIECITAFSTNAYNDAIGGNIKCAVDHCISGTGTINIAGWAFDNDNLEHTLDIHIYVGGEAGATNADLYVISANKPRPDINVAYGAGEYHGFNDTVVIKKSGLQTIYVYAYNPNTDQGSFIEVFNVNITPDIEAPIITNAYISDVSVNGYTVTCTVNDNISIDRVQFPTWTRYNDQDDLATDWVTNKSVSGTANGNTYTFKVNASDHNNEQGIYATHIYAFDIAGNMSVCVELSTEVWPAIRGYVDGCIGEVGSILVEGWAVAPYSLEETIDIHIYIGAPSTSNEAERHVISANQYREDIYGGSYHGFKEHIVTQKYGTQDVYFYAVNNSTSEIIECVYSPQTVNITRGLEGHLDSCVGDAGVIRVGGWALDHSDLDETVDVHVYIGGSSSSTDAEFHAISADEYREDIYNGSYHGFNTTITTKKYGTQDVYFYAVNYSTGSNIFISSVTVDIGIAVTDVKIDTTKLILSEGENYTISATVEPENATNKSVIWATSDASVATVENGIVTAVSPGKAIITATVDGKSAICEVVVNKQIDYAVNALESIVSDGSCYAEVQITKNTDRDAVDTIVIAVYKDDVIVDMAYMKGKFAKGQTVIFGGMLEGVEGASLKAFVWDSIQGMKALSNVVEK